MRTLLIVDDNTELAAALGMVAKSLGFTVHIAHTGGEALAKVDAEKPAAALVDLLLPDISGLDLLHGLKARGVPTFAMSGAYRGETVARACVKEGALLFFEKPFAAREAIDTIIASLPESDGAGHSSAADEDDGRGQIIIDELPTELIDDGGTTGGAVTWEEPVSTPLLAGSISAHEAPEEAPAAPELPPPELPPETSDDVSPWGSAAAESPEADASSLHEIEITDVANTLPEPNPVEPEPILLDDLEPIAVLPSFPATVTFATQDAALTAEEGAAGDEHAQASAPLENEGDSGPILPVPLVPGAFARRLAELARRRATSHLQVTRDPIAKTVFVHQGQIVDAVSNLGSERLERLATRSGVLPPDRAAKLQAELQKGTPTADALVAMGIAPQEQCREIVAHLVRGIVGSLLDADGEWQMRETPSAPLDAPHFALDTIPLVLEGYRGAFALVRLRALVDPAKRFVHTAHPHWGPREMGLSREEAEILSAADGSKTIEDLLALTELGERQVLAVLVGLTHMGFVEARLPPARRVMLF